MTHGPSLPLTLTATLSQTLLNSSTSWPVIVGLLMIFFFTVVLTITNTQTINISMMWFLKSLDHHLKLQAILSICFFTCVSVCVCVCVCSITRLFPVLCISIDCSPPGSSVRGIFQAGILEWGFHFLLQGSSQPRDQTSISCISCIGRWILYHCSSWGACFSSVQVV